MKSLTRLLAVFLLVGWVCADELPDAPHMKMRHPVETYSPDERMIVHNSPSAATEKPGRLFDWTFIAVHAAYAGALATDLKFTSDGVGHGCEEASSNLGPFPTNGKLVRNGLIEFGAVLGGDLALKALARHLKLPAYVSVMGGSVGAGIGAFKHTRGALAWTRTNCL